MEKTATLNLRVSPEVKKSAEMVLSQLGVPMATAIDMFLKQIALTGSIPFFVALPKTPSVMEARQKGELLLRQHALIEDDLLIDVKNATGKPVKYGGWEGKATISDDFNAPLDDFEEYM